MKTESPQLHPCIQHNDVYQQVCRPLQRLGIEFFGYTAIDTLTNAYCLGSKTNYAEQYLAKEHAKKDVHFDPKTTNKQLQYYFWDFANLSKDEQDIYQLAFEHGQGHTLTVTKQTANMTHCYHFSGHIDDHAINQRFLDKMDFIHAFMDYFDDCLTHIPEISNVYKHPLKIDRRPLEHDLILIANDPKMLNFDQASSYIRFKNFAEHYLTEKERSCLYWLYRGKSLAMIAQIMQVSNKTIERRIASIKNKYDCYTLFQLGQKTTENGLNELLNIA